MHIVLGVPYKVSVTCLRGRLARDVRHLVPRRGDADIHSIVTPRREMFYWLR